MDVDNRSKRILVSGATGFIGGHLLPALEGHTIETVSDFDDIRGEYDVVIHLAAKASVPYSIKSPFESYMVNVVGTLKMLEVCRQTGAKLIFASSSQAQANALSPYGLQKYNCEELINMYARLYGVRFCILRLYSVFGKGDRSVISAFLQAAEAKEPLQVWGGDQLRDFVHVDAVVAKFVEGIDVEGTYDVGSGVRWKISQIADMISDNQVIKEMVPYERMEARCLNPVKSLSVEEYIEQWKS